METSLVVIGFPPSGSGSGSQSVMSPSSSANRSRSFFTSTRFLEELPVQRFITLSHLGVRHRTKR